MILVVHIRPENTLVGAGPPVNVSNSRRLHLYFSLLVFGALMVSSTSLVLFSNRRAGHWSHLSSWPTPFNWARIFVMIFAVVSLNSLLSLFVTGPAAGVRALAAIAATLAAVVLTFISPAASTPHERRPTGKSRSSMATRRNPGWPAQVSGTAVGYLPGSEPTIPAIRGSHPDDDS